MKTMTPVLALALLAMVATSCMPAATDQELGAMCENLMKLKGEAELSTEADLLKEVEEDFADKLKKLEDWRARDLAGWDKELAAKLEAAEDDEAKATITAEYTKKKEVTSKQFAPDIEKLGPAKANAIKVAKQKVVDDKAAYDKAIKTCVDEGKKEGINQKVATCRAEAVSTDKYWNFCR